MTPDNKSIDEIAREYAEKKYGNYETTSLEGRIKISVAKSSFKDGVLTSSGMTWVSVEDRLPDYGYCLASYYNPSDVNRKLYVVTVYKGRIYWYWNNDEKEKAEDETLKITHWMPLPTPPLTHVKENKL